MIARRLFLSTLLGSSILPAIADSLQPEEIKVSLEPLTNHKPSLYITIDDGWRVQEPILRVLLKYNAVGTFFISGQPLLTYAPIWRKALEVGMEFGCHGFYHSQASHLTEAEFRNELELYKNAAVQVFGADWRKTVPFFRFPYGNEGGHKNKALFAQILLDEFGWQHLNWDLDLSFFHNGRRAVSAFHDVKTPMSLFKKEHTADNILLFHFAPNDLRTIEALLDEYQNTYSFIGVSKRIAS